MFELGTRTFKTTVKEFRGKDGQLVKGGEYQQRNGILKKNLMKILELKNVPLKIIQRSIAKKANKVDKLVY